MGRKTVAPGHVVENGVAPANENGTALDNLQEPEGLYAPGMAPLASEDPPETPPEAPRTTQVDPEAQGPDTNTHAAPDVTEAPQGEPDTTAPAHTDAEDDDPEELCLVVLKNGGTFCFRGQLFRKGEPTATEQETAERLVRSGYFERG